MSIVGRNRKKAFEDLVKIATQICQRPIADIRFVDECQQWSKASVAAKLSETPLDAALCAQAILETGLFVVPNALDNLRFIYNPFVRNAPELRFYAGAVIKTDKGLPLGTVCVMDVKPRPQGLTQEQSGTLLTLAESVMNLLIEHLTRPMHL